MFRSSQPQNVDLTQETYDSNGKKGEELARLIEVDHPDDGDRCGGFQTGALLTVYKPPSEGDTAEAAASDGRTE